MKLENLNLVELNAQEVKEVEGGGPYTRGKGPRNGGGLQYIGHALGDFFEGIYDAL